MVLDEVALYLQEAGVAALGLTLFKGSMPLEAPAGAEQQPLIALVEVPGLPPLEVHEGLGASIEQPVVQVVIRGLPDDYLSAWNQADAAYLALDGVTNVVLDGTSYLWIWALQPPFFLRTDAMGRSVIIFNIRCARSLL